MTNRKIRVAALSVASNTMLVVLKLLVGLHTGAVSIISEAIHSLMDLIASVIALLSVRISSKPPDETHPYGHGKIENISGVVEGLLIFLAAFLIIKEAIQKITTPHLVIESEWGIAVMTVSALANTIVSTILYRTARAEDSIALEADALHLKTDVYTSLGVAAGLLLIKLSGISIFDPVVAILVALLIVKEAWNLSSHAFQPLIDSRLNVQEEERIKKVLERYQSKIIDYHRLRTRRAGHVKYIDFHVTGDRNLTLDEFHQLGQQIERDLEAELKNTNVSIHFDPGPSSEDGHQ